MKQRILSFALALCLCISSPSTAYAFEEETFAQEDVYTEEEEEEADAGQSVIADQWNFADQSVIIEDVNTASLEESVSEPIPYDSTIPTPSEVYEKMIALKEQELYKEGASWTNDYPYSDSKGYYRWKGGMLGGKNIVAVGCVAFAFILSDTAFDSLPARMYETVKYEDIKVGDILRMDNDAHTVIVLEVSEAGVIVAEGNISTGDHKGKVHWGRAISKEMVVRDISHYITRYPEGYIAPDDPTANDSIANGTLTGGLTWKLTKGGTLTISGSGAMPDFSSATDQPWATHSNTVPIRKVVIGNGVTSIGSCAFWGCGVLSAEISSTVTTIGNNAFRESSIISATIPSNVKTIGDSAFRECQNLSSVAISEGVETIEQNAFRSCTSLASIDLPASIGEVGAGTFFQCTEMKSATFAPGDKQVNLGDDLFAGCYYLMKVTLPQSIDRIGTRMFMNCSLLPGVEIPQGVVSIENNAFASCKNFTTVIIPDSVTTIGTAAFQDCALKDIYFTGTETQWKNINIMADTKDVVSKATIHYNYTPEEDKPDDNQPDDNNPGGDQPGDNDPGGDQPGDNNPGGDQPGDNNPGGDQPGDNNPGGNNPGGNTPGGSKPDNSKPGNNNTEQDSRPEAGIPFIKDENGKSGWDVIRAKEETIEEGGVIHVDMNNAAVVPGDIFESIKGRDVTITFDMGNGILWSVDGKSVTADQIGDIDLSVRTGTDAIPANIVSSAAGGNYRMQLSLSHEGEFGFTAVLSINLSKENAGRTAALYYYNPGANALELVCRETTAEDGTVRLTFTHASDYLIVVDSDTNVNGNKNGTTATQNKAPRTGDRENRMLWWSIMTAALAVILGTAFQGKRKKR